MFSKLKSNWLFLTLLIISGTFIMVIQNNSIYAKDAREDGLLLMRTLEEMNIEAEMIQLAYSSSIGSNESAGDIQSFKTKIEKAFKTKLSLNSDHQEHGIYYEGQRTISTSLNTNLRILWTGVPEENFSKNKSYKTYLVVSFSGDKLDQKGYLKNYSLIRQSLETLSIDPKIMINIQGNINQKLSHGDQQQLIKNMFDQLNASVSEGLNEKEVISLTGFSNRLSYSINSNGKPINLQIASRYNPRSGKTSVTIGTPVITMEY